jgi:hypothetical protein
MSLRPPAQGFVDDFLEFGVAVATQALNLGGDIVVEGKGRSHATTHTSSDVLMPTSP